MTKAVAFITMMITSSLLQGCATTIAPPGAVNGAVRGGMFFTPSRMPDADTINAHIYKKIEQNVVISISDRDLSMQNDSHFGLLGYLFPIRVFPGKELKAYANEYFFRLFNRVGFEKQSDDNLIIHVEIISFDISASSKAAHLEAGMTVKDRDDRLLFEKRYIGQGEGHFPLYLAGPAQQEEQIKRTTNQAFEQVFNEIVKDIQADSRLGG